MGTDFIVHHSPMMALIFIQPYHLVVDHGYGHKEVPLESTNTQPYDLHVLGTLGCEEHCMCTVRKLEQAFTVDCFDDIVLLMPLLAPAAA